MLVVPLALMLQQFDLDRANLAEESGAERGYVVAVAERPWP